MLETPIFIIETPTKNITTFGNDTITILILLTSISENNFALQHHS